MTNDVCLHSGARLDPHTLWTLHRIERLSPSPDLTRDVDDELHLAPLLVLGEEVAFEG